MSEAKGMSQNIASKLAAKKRKLKQSYDHDHKYS